MRGEDPPPRSGPDRPRHGASRTPGRTAREIRQNPRDRPGLRATALERALSPMKRILTPRRLAATLLLTSGLLYGGVRQLVGDGGVALVADHQVLVRHDLATGSLTADDHPGAHTFVPWLEEVHVLDRRTLRYVMGGEGPEPDQRVPALVVRGRDGANYAFLEVELQVAIDGARAAVAFVDHGATKETVLRLVDAYARPVLRAAFGAYEPRDIVLPANKQEGTEVATAELGRLLERHGVQLLELSVSKPQFAPKYQETIQRRKVAEQDVVRLEGERLALVAGQDDRLEELLASEERRLEALERELVEAERLAERAAAELVARTERETADQLAAATLERDTRVARAKVLETRHRADAAAFVAQLDALAAQGDITVRSALVEQLDAVTFDLVPVQDVVEATARPAGGAQGSAGGVVDSAGGAL